MAWCVKNSGDNMYVDQMDHRNHPWRWNVQDLTNDLDPPNIQNSPYSPEVLPKNQPMTIVEFIERYEHLPQCPSFALQPPCKSRENIGKHDSPNFICICEQFLSRTYDTIMTRKSKECPHECRLVLVRSTSDVDRQAELMDSIDVDMIDMRIRESKDTSTSGR